MADGDKPDTSKEVEKAGDATTESKKATATKGSVNKKTVKKRAAKKKTTKKRAATKKKTTSETRPKEEVAAEAASVVDSVQASQEKTVAPQQIQNQPEKQEPMPVTATAVASSTGKGMSFWPKTLVWVVLVIAGFLYLRHLAHDPSNRIGSAKDQPQKAPVTFARKEAGKETQASSSDTQKMITKAGETGTSSPEFQAGSIDDAAPEVAPPTIDSADDSSVSSIKESKRETDPAVSQDQMGSEMRGALNTIEAGKPPAVSVQPEDKTADDAMVQTGERTEATTQTEVTLPRVSGSSPQAEVTLPEASAATPPTDL